MPKRVAMTGATGFVGRHTLALLKARGHRIRALARDPSKLEGVETVAGDLADPRAFKRLVHGCDVVVHIAGAIAAPSRDGFFAANETGARHAVEAARDANVPHFVHISSLAAREPSLNDYCASKRAGEEAVKAHSGRTRVALIRPPAVYGPGDTATLPLLQSLMRRFAIIPGRADARLSVIYVEDLARMIADAAEANWAGLREVSDGRRGGYRWSDLTSAIAAVEGRRITPVHAPYWLARALAATRLVPALTAPKLAELYFPDWATRGEADPGFTRTGFEEGFRRTAEWYRSRGQLKPARRANKSSALISGDPAS